MKAQVTLSEEYGTSVNIYTFTWGDEDAKSFTIRNQGTIDTYTRFTLSIEDGYNRIKTVQFVHVVLQLNMFRSTPSK